MQVKPPVRLASMQKNRDGYDGDVSQYKRSRQHLPPRPLQQAARKKLKYVIHAFLYKTSLMLLHEV